jgi:hypothetical protein
MRAAPRASTRGSFFGAAECIRRWPIHITENTNARQIERTHPRCEAQCTSASPAEVYAVTAWSVKKSGDNWYIAETACFDNKPQWSKAYASLYRATTAIARKLAEDVLRRQKRRREQAAIKN